MTIIVHHWKRASFCITVLNSVTAALSSMLGNSSDVFILMVEPYILGPQFDVSVCVGVQPVHVNRLSKNLHISQFRGHCNCFHTSAQFNVGELQQPHQPTSLQMVQIMWILNSSQCVPPSISTFGRMEYSNLCHPVRSTSRCVQVVLDSDPAYRAETRRCVIHWQFGHRPRWTLWVCFKAGSINGWNSMGRT